MPQLTNRTPSLLWLGVLLWGVASVGRAGCEPPRADELQAVNWQAVIDGDSLVLEDVGQLRLIGVNTPELGRDGAEPQPLAVAARRELLRYLEHRPRLYLLRGSERRDRYGRLLAHSFTSPHSGPSLAEHLLREGLGFQVVVAPNTRFIDCLAAAEAEARRAGRGVWAHPAYTVKPAASLSRADTGFQRVSGRVSAVSETRKAWWLVLEGPLTLRVDKQHLHYFDEPLRAWTGRQLTARGWVAPHRGQGPQALMMRLSHPAMIEHPSP